MLHEGRPSAQLKEWTDRLAPVVAKAQAILSAADPAKLARRSGCDRHSDGSLRLAFFGQELAISAGEFVVSRADSGEPASSFTSSVVLTYLATADGTTPSGRWIGFRELPNGLFYADAFQGYSGARLVRELQGGVEAFRSAAEALGGQEVEIGDAGYAFPALPRVRLALAFWEGDEELAAQARVLFEDSAALYMPTDGLAILGSPLVGRLLKAAG
ncbi:MAG: DUF3786 domain-containing protein [Anaerolineales bacterium]|nr:MAG: DUF3786 domain-containing protein [Anaerolineales bacterium]